MEVLRLPHLRDIILSYQDGKVARECLQDVDNVLACGHFSLLEKAVSDPLRFGINEKLLLPTIAAYSTAGQSRDYKSVVEYLLNHNVIAPCYAGDEIRI